MSRRKSSELAEAVLAEAGNERVFKLLLLGAGETGKSTLLKQLLLHYDQREKMDVEVYTKWMHRNIVSSAQGLIRVAQSMDLSMDAALAEAVLDYPDDESLDASKGGKIKELWCNGPLKEAYRLNTIHAIKLSGCEDKELLNAAGKPVQWVLDQAPFYLDSIDRILAANFTPTDEDMVRTRVLTIGTNSVDFTEQVDGAYLMKYLPVAANMLEEKDLKVCSIKWSVIDVGGQRNERRKWLHLLDDVMCLVWTCGLVEYLQVLYEESCQIRVNESLELFSKWANQKQFSNVPIMLVFSKHDRFKETYNEDAFCKVFSETNGWKGSPFQGGDAAAALKFLTSTFQEKLDQTNRKNKELYTHAVNLLDSGEMQDLMEGLKRMVASHNGDAILDLIQKNKQSSATPSSGGKSIMGRIRTSIVGKKA